MSYKSKTLLTSIDFGGIVVEVLINICGAGFFNARRNKLQLDVILFGLIKISIIQFQMY